MFDDDIHAGATGVSLSGFEPAADPLLRERSRSAEVVARMRVQTITRDRLGEWTRYSLSLQVGYPTLMPAKIDNRNFEFAILPASRAFGIVSSLEQSMRGRTFIGFVRRFPGAEGVDIHWHLTADTAEVARVIHDVAMLEEVIGP